MSAISLANLVNNALFASSTNWTGFSVSGGVGTFSGQSWGATVCGTTYAIPDVSGRKYYYAVSAKVSNVTRDTRYGIGGSPGGGGVFEAPYIQTSTTDFLRRSYIRTSATTQNIYTGVYVPDATTTTIYCNGMLYIDLTTAFGAGNEPSLAWCDENIPFFNGTTVISLAKKIMGISNVSVKKVSGLIIASVKKIEGLDNV